MTNVHVRYNIIRHNFRLISKKDLEFLGNVSKDLYKYFRNIANILINRKIVLRFREICCGDNTSVSCHLFKGVI